MLTRGFVGKNAAYAILTTPIPKSIARTREKLDLNHKNTGVRPGFLLHYVQLLIEFRMFCTNLE